MYEEEADRIAEQVARMPEPRLQRKCICGGQCPECRSGQGQMLEQLRTNRVGPNVPVQTAAPPIVHEVLRSPGHPLDRATRAYMEARLAHDFSEVRVHGDALAEDSARALGARAFTVGQHIVFGAGQVASATGPGQRLLAHELTHVIQQTARGDHDAGQARIQRQPDPPQARAPMLPKKIIAGSTPLSRETQRYAADNRVPDGTNLLAVEFSVGSDRQIKVFENRKSVAHTEPIMEQYFRDLRKPVTVHEVYSERQPCGFSEQNCEKLLRGERYRNAQVTFGYNYQETRSPAPKSRAARSRDLIDAHHERVNQTKQLEWDFVPKDPPAHYEVNEPEPPSKRPRRLGGRGRTGTSARAVGVPVASRRGQARGVLAEVGAQLILSMQLESVRSAELQKAVTRYLELMPEVERLLEEGYSVTLTVEAEVPKQLDIAASMAGVGDASQVVYFRAMYIKAATKAVSVLGHRGVPQTTANPVGEVREGFGDPHRSEDPHELNLHQQIRMQMGDPDPAGWHKAKRSTHRVVTRDQTFTPSTPASPPPVQTPLAAPPPTVKPRLDYATRQGMAKAPSRIYILSGTIKSYPTALAVMKKIAGNPSFGEVKESLGGYQKRTEVIYFSDLDKPRAEVLAEIVRSEGVPSVRLVLSGDGSDAPGTLQIFFGSDANREQP